MEIIERRENGSYVIIKDGKPYHLIPGDPLWEAVCEQEGVDPKEQTSFYAASLMPPQLAEKEVHMSAGIE